MTQPARDHVDSDRAGRLYGVAQALTAALSPEDVANAVFARALADLGASTTGFWLLEGDAIRFAGGAGHVDDAPARVGLIPLDSDLPAAVCVRTGDFIAYGSRAERDARWPSLSILTKAAEAVAVLPLTVSGRTFGALHIGYPSPQPVEDMDIPLLGRVAELCAAALDRSRLYERERTQREQLEFFADATRVLIRSLDPADVVQALVETAVPRLSDWCAVLIPDRDYLRTVAVRIAGDDGSQAAIAARETFDIGADHLVARCFRAAEVQMVDPIPETATSTLGPATADAVRQAGVKSALLVPIEWAGQAIGVLALAFRDAGRASKPRLQEMARGLALRAGVALHNAGMYDAERTVARTLTQALLPPTTPAIPGYDAAVAYLPAAGDVAGDWYDVVELEGRFLVGVGDAAGHGIPAATLMAELRNGARGLAAADHRPAELLDALTRLVDREAGEPFATAVYALLDPATHDVEWALAGHPPPVFVHAGQAALLDHIDGRSVEGLPIAAEMGGRRTEQRLRLDPGDLLVLYTDGVIERRRTSIELGIERLSALLTEMANESAAAVTDAIVTQLCADAADDCCVLVLRRR